MVQDDPHPMIAKRMSWTANPAAFDAVLVDQSAAGRINPLLIAKTAEEMLCNLDFGKTRFAGYKRQDVISKRHAESIHDPSLQYQERASMPPPQRVVIGSTEIAMAGGDGLETRPL
jgi:hypothetical protein